MSLVSCNVSYVGDKGSPDKGQQMAEKKEFCYDCEVELTDENTAGFGGFDGSNYLSSRGFADDLGKDFFTKCDNCFEADIDRTLD